MNSKELESLKQRIERGELIPPAEYGTLLDLIRAVQSARSLVDLGVSLLIASAAPETAATLASQRLWLPQSERGLRGRRICDRCKAREAVEQGADGTRGYCRPCWRIATSGRE